ncbi:unnamed protein product [Effrenium voratum]|nr:unnamed protein product [Effrenium voratum]
MMGLSPEQRFLVDARIDQDTLVTVYNAELSAAGQLPRLHLDNHAGWIAHSKPTHGAFFQLKELCAGLGGFSQKANFVGIKTVACLDHSRLACDALWRQGHQVVHAQMEDMEEWPIWSNADESNLQWTLEEEQKYGDPQYGNDLRFSVISSSTGMKRFSHPGEYQHKLLQDRLLRWITPSMFMPRTLTLTEVCTYYETAPSSRLRAAGLATADHTWDDLAALTNIHNLINYNACLDNDYTQAICWDRFRWILYDELQDHIASRASSEHGAYIPAMHFINDAQSISTDALAIITTSELPTQPTVQQAETIRFPAVYTGTNEPVLLTGSLIQIGDTTVKRVTKSAEPLQDEIATATIRVSVFADECPHDWQAFVKAPIKSIVKNTPLLQKCPDASCANIQDAKHRARTCDSALAITRLGNKFGIRVQEQVKIHSIYRLFPLPHGIQRNGATSNSITTSPQQDPWLLGGDPWAKWHHVSGDITMSPVVPQQSATSSKKIDQLGTALKQDMQEAIRTEVAKNADALKLMQLEVSVQELRDQSKRFENWFHEVSQHGQKQGGDLKLLQQVVTQQQGDLTEVKQQIRSQGDALQAAVGNIKHNLSSQIDTQFQRFEALLAKKSTRRLTMSARIPEATIREAGHDRTSRLIFTALLWVTQLYSCAATELLAVGTINPSGLNGKEGALSLGWIMDWGAHRYRDAGAHFRRRAHHYDGPTYPDARALTDRLLATITREMVVGFQGVRVVAGDFNHDESALPQIALWKQHGWVETQQLALALWQQQPQPTCKGATQRDLIFLSPEAAALTQRVRVKDVLVDLWTKAQQQQIRRWRQPAAIPWDSINIPRWHSASFDPIHEQETPTEWYQHFAYSFENSLNGQRPASPLQRACPLDGT